MICSPHRVLPEEKEGQKERETNWSRHPRFRDTPTPLLLRSDGSYRVLSSKQISNFSKKDQCIIVVMRLAVSDSPHLCIKKIAQHLGFWNAFDVHLRSG